MKIIKTTFLILIVWIGVACQDQAGLLVGGVFKNLFNGNLFEGSATDSAYDQMKTQTESLKRANRPDCIVHSTEVIGDDVIANLGEIKENICSCKAWGSCDKNSCECGKLCPMSFEIFKRSSQTLGSSLEDQFAFDNVSIGKNYSNYEGFCWGFASLSQKFQRLSSFALMKKVPDEYNRDPFRKKEYYKELIRRIKNNEPVEIPGYKSIRHFTSDPMIQELMTPEIESTWQENAVSWQGLQSVKTGKRMSPNEYNKVFDELEYQLANNHAPKVLFNKEGVSGWAHVVQVQSVKRDGMGIRYLCVWDNAFPLDQSQDCQKKMTLDSNGKLVYGYREIGSIQLPHDEKSETVAQVTNLQKECNQKYFCN